MGVEGAVFLCGKKMKMTDSNQKLPYIPVKCVVCNGFGTVNWGKSQCHACQGRGYILIPNRQTDGLSMKKEKERNDGSR